MNIKDMHDINTHVRKCKTRLTSDKYRHKECNLLQAWQITNMFADLLINVNANVEFYVEIYSLKSP